jgi:hypothetical protein
MRKFLVCLTVAAFAAVTSLQAADQCPMAKTSCCDQAKTSCCASKTAKTSACSGSAKVAKKNADVKGATLLVKR